MKIVSDGTRQGTKLLDDSGKQIQGVLRVQILADKDEPFVTALIEIAKVELEMTVRDTNAGRIP
jgi:hypothetical protein